jgi:hypothetical protein
VKLPGESDDRQRRFVDLQASLEQLARDGEEREKTLIDLQLSVTRYTRWPVALTIVLAVLGVAAIATTIWAATR